MWNFSGDKAGSTMREVIGCFQLIIRYVSNFNESIVSFFLANRGKGTVFDSGMSVYDVVGDRSVVPLFIDFV